MSSACTPILVGVASPVSEILPLLKTAKFPFLTYFLSLSQDVSLLTPEEVSDELGLSLHKLSFSQTLTLDGHFVADSNILDLLTAAIIKY